MQNKPGCAVRSNRVGEDTGPRHGFLCCRQQGRRLAGDTAQVERRQRGQHRAHEGQGILGECSGGYAKPVNGHKEGIVQGATCERLSLDGSGPALCSCQRRFCGRRQGRLRCAQLVDIARPELGDERADQSPERICGHLFCCAHFQSCRVGLELHHGVS